MAVFDYIFISICKLYNQSCKNEDFINIKLKLRLLNLPPDCLVGPDLYSKCTINPSHLS